MLLDEAHNKIQELQEKEHYTTYQEDLGFKKELTILRNDFYYQMTAVKEESVSLVDFLYQPFDTMSGDAYTARKINEFQTVYLVLDGMGKGLSASLTAMIMTSFTNHIIDKMLQHNHFDLYLLIFETLHYIQNTLLADEALAIDYILIDDENNLMSYAKFAMPVLLMQNNKDEIIRLKSNNPPMSKYQNDFKVSNYDISDIKKFLFYSDGIVENETIHKNKPYSKFIEEDFKNSFTRKELTNNIFSKLSTQEDDLTLIFIHKLDLNKNTLMRKHSFNTTLNQVDIANEWYETVLDECCELKDVKYKAGLVFTEFFMNAYEHGNLGVGSQTKHQLLSNNTYFETLLQREKKCSKTISVIVKKIRHLSNTYIITTISDEGKGFNTQILSEIFRNSQTFNGRGVFVSRTNSMGIYYNALGNSVLYIHKIAS